MGLTHIVRGEDLVTATPRQLALYAALGHPQERWPAFAHLPLIVGNDNAPLSKRHGEVSLAWYRAQGFLPEALANYLSLLGWSPGGDREFFGEDVLLAEFDVRRVEPQSGALRHQETPGAERRLDPVADRCRSLPRASPRCSRRPA